jgi:hypothetical protein
MDGDPMIDDEVGAHTKVTVLAYWKFESVSLQQRVGLSGDIAFPRDLGRKASRSRGFARVCEPRRAARPAETRRAPQYRANGR